MDYPPQVGGAARYHAAVAAALGKSCTVQVLPRDQHWLHALPRLLFLTNPSDHVIVGEVLPTGTLAWMRSWISLPYSVICHGLDLVRAAQVTRRRWLVSHILCRASHVIVNSAFTATLATSAGARRERIAVVPPPLGITSALAQPAQAPDVRRAHSLERSRIVLSVGRLVERKGFDTLIRAMAIVRRTHPRAILVIIGDGAERVHLEALARRETIAVRFIGACSDAETAAWYAASDVFALLPRELPSGDIEGFGIVYLEAGAFGKPVVGARSGGVPEAVLDGETGLLVPSNDPDAAAVAITRLLSDRDLSNDLGNAARTRAQEFSQGHFAERLRRALDVK